MKEVSVAVDGEEARISFVDHMHGEMSVREKMQNAKNNTKMLHFGQTPCFFP